MATDLLTRYALYFKPLNALRTSTNDNDGIGIELNQWELRYPIYHIVKKLKD